MQERGKKETSKYISDRSAEYALLSIFGKYSKATKLSSADKYYKVLNNQAKDVVFTKDEREALQDDTDSRLTTIYSRYKSIAPVA